MEELQNYDIERDRAQLSAELNGSEEIDRLTGLIDVSDMNSIVTFGAGAAQRISDSADAVLRSTRMSQTDDSAAMLDALGKLMGQFDFDELEGDTSLFSRIFGNVRRQLDKMLDKYRTLGDEVDRIFAQLKKYESGIRRDDRILQEMFYANIDTYHELVKYILAAEQGCREIEAYLEQRRAYQKTSGDPTVQFEIITLEQALDLLKRRVQDLKTAEIVAMQSVPMIRLMQFNNMQLAQKINSAFIVTLPVFKQALSQAILLKRQSIQNEAIERLNKRTGEMLGRNAQIVARQTESLQSSKNAIMDGIKDVQSLLAERESAAKQLESAQNRH